MLEKTKYLNPTNDVSFKKLFGTEEHKPLLISFLNSILGLEGKRRIKEIELLSKDQAPLIRETKSSVLDIKCTDQRQLQYIVEMQNKTVPGFVKRAQFYASHSYITQLPSGSSYVEIKPVILLAIANYELFGAKERVISYHKTLDIHTLENDLQDLSYVFIELPKFTKNQSELESLQDKWLYFFANWEETREIPQSVQEKELLEAYRSMEEYNWSIEEREAYIKANIALTDEYDARKKAEEIGIQKGRKEGREEGRKEGEKIGIQKGREEGEKIAEKRLKSELAKKMLSVMSKEEVADMMAWTLSEIEEIE